MEKINILGLDFLNISLPQAAEHAILRTKAGLSTMVVTANAEFGKLAIESEDFCSLFNSADMLVADGAGVLLASKILKKPLAGKVAGIDLAALIAEQAAKEKLPVFLLGSKPGIAEKAAQNLKRRFFGINIAGTADGYFKDEKIIIEKIRDSGAKILFVCLGAPKQEKLMADNRQKLEGVLMIGLGGTLDVLAGEVKRAPKIFIDLNLEWFYRLIKQPSRIIRMLKLPAYIFDAICARLKLKNTGENK